ncbi:hypothetical protein Scep_021756 [Stephania cephalantha]|uniref:Uncharacterized protein n=1 Tax=Stephania cephalantha TaxID=152367 RepID=A0AAP0F9J8_9MAGN
MLWRLLSCMTLQDISEILYGVLAWALARARLDLDTFLGTFLGGEHSGVLARALAQARLDLGTFLGMGTVAILGMSKADSLGTSKAAPWHEQGRTLADSLGTSKAAPWHEQGRAVARARSSLGTGKAYLGKG